MNDTRVAPTATKWVWPFELLERIGEGGMGVVYRARYVVNNREVAVKMLPADVSDKTVLARFEREMEVLKNLRHANIVRCFGGACEDKQRFYAMELISGGSLEDVLQSRGKLGWEQVVEYGQQMCAALTCSHGAGVIHRDVKPSNFLMGANGVLKLSDFGLATVVAARRITAAGKTAGTLLYMSPEQIRGGEITPASDVYALGCVFYELLTGRPPFVGDSPAATLHMHCKAEIPRASQVALDCPPAFDALIQRMMAKDPAQRPASAEVVSQELTRVIPAITVVQTRRSGSGGSRISHRPTGSDPDVARAEVPRPVAPPRESGLPHWVPVALAVALASSLLANFVQRRGEMSARDWRTASESLANHSDPAVRRSAVETVGNMEGSAAERAEFLRSRLDDSDPFIRVAAIQGLARTGSTGRSAMLDLMRLQKDDANSVVREAATAAVKTIRETPKQGSWTWILGILGVLTAAGAGGYVWTHRASPD